MIVSFQELKLLPKNLRMHQVAIEKRVCIGMIGRDDPVIIRDCIAARGHRAIEPPDAMQCRVHGVLKEWADQSHRLGVVTL
jgi:hypothetical protein